MLTSELLKEDVRLTAIENDHALMEGLQGRFQEVQSVLSLPTCVSLARQAAPSGSSRASLIREGQMVAC